MSYNRQNASLLRIPTTARLAPPSAVEQQNPLLKLSQEIILMIVKSQSSLQGNDIAFLIAATDERSIFVLGLFLFRGLKSWPVLPCSLGNH